MRRSVGPDRRVAQSRIVGSTQKTEGSIARGPRIPGRLDALSVARHLLHGTAMTAMRGLGIFFLAVLALGSCLVLGCSDDGNGAAGTGGHPGTAGGSAAGGHGGQAPGGIGGSAGGGPGGSAGAGRGGSAGGGPGGSAGGVAGAGGATAGRGGGGSGGTGGTAGQGGGGGGGGASACAALTTLQACDARTDCHAVFDDPGTCGCGSPGCCAHFARCADGDRASCTPAALLCKAAQPFCEQPYVVGYVGSCYEGCVRASECMGAGGSGGGAGAGGSGGGAGGRGGAGGGGGSTSCNADPSVCGPSGVCLRKQVIGGVCLFADGGCQPGYSAAGQCCVMDPVYTCVPRPSSCTGDVTCTCAASTLCAGGYTCMSPKTGEIACTLLAP
jgi:hypothetical protein